VGHVAGGRDDDARRHVLLGEVAENGVPAESGHRLARAQDGPTQRVIRPHLRGEDVVNHVIRRVLDHLDFLEHHGFLALELVGVEEGMEQDVSEQIDGQREMLVEHLDVEARVLLGGEGVHLPTHRVHGARDVLGGARGRALEDEMLDEMGHPAPALRLVARPRLHPHPDRHRPDVRHPLRDEPDAVGQDTLTVGLVHVLTRAGADPRSDF
jgi:hypothetical protein